MASGTLRTWISWPSLMIVPADVGAVGAAEERSASSVRPAPIRPAKPTISPRRTMKLEFLQTSRSGRSGAGPSSPSPRRTPRRCSGVWSGNRLSSSRPTMPRMIRSSSTPSALTSRVSIVLPSRRIVIESAICSISLSLCEIMIEVTPWSRRSRIRSSRCWESASFSAAVGSSRISSFTSLANALAISTSCCLPTPMSLIRVSGSSFRPTRASSSSASRRRLPVDDAAAGRLVAEEDVLGDRQLGDQRELLVDDHDAGVLAGADVAELALLALVDDRRRCRCRTGRPRTAPSSGSTCRRRSRRRSRGSRRRAPSG